MLCIKAQTATALLILRLPNGSTNVVPYKPTYNLGGAPRPPCHSLAKRTLLNLLTRFDFSRLSTATL